MYKQNRNSGEKVHWSIIKTLQFWKLAVKNLLPFFPIWVIVSMLFVAAGSSIEGVLQYTVTFGVVVFIVNIVLVGLYRYEDSLSVRGTSLDLLKKLDRFIEKISDEDGIEREMREFEKLRREHESWCMLHRLEMIIHHASIALSLTFFAGFNYLAYTENPFWALIVVIWSALTSWQVVAYSYSRGYNDTNEDQSDALNNVKQLEKDIFDT